MRLHSAPPPPCTHATVMNGAARATSRRLTTRVTAATDAAAPPDLPSSRSAPAAPAVANLSPAQLAANASLADAWRNQLILAPLTRVGTLPFRRLAAEFGARVTLSEMAFARPLAKGDRVERARLRHTAGLENWYGVQLATNSADELVRAAQLAADAGARFVDINCGCPIHEATRRGLGAAMLRRPAKLARLIAVASERCPLPLTVKIRTGITDATANVDAMVPALAAAGAAIVTIHGRSGEGRYKKSARWDTIAAVAAASPSLPVAGNGDVLTRLEATARLATPGVHAVMVGRGALIKPWLFAEVADAAEWLPDEGERVAVWYKLVRFFREYLGDDARGESKAAWFVPDHIDWLARYRLLPESVYGSADASIPPLMHRRDDVADPALGETLASLTRLERLLRCSAPDAHKAIAATLWRATSEVDAVARLQALAVSELDEWEAFVKAVRREDGRSGGDERDDASAGR